MTENPKQDQPTPEQGARLRALPWYVFIPLVGVVVLAMIGLAALTGTLPTPTGTQVAQASPSAPATVAPIVVTATPDPNATAAPSTTPVLTLITVTPSITPTPSATNTPTATASPTINPITVVQNAKNLGLLVTQNQEGALSNVEVVLKYGMVCEITAQHLVLGSVQAGVDLRELGANAVTVDQQTGVVTLRLPAPRLTDCQIDEIDQYNIIGEVPVTCPADKNIMRRLATNASILAFRDEALEGQILRDARREAEITLRTLFSQLNIEIRIVFDESDPPLPETCAPSITGRDFRGMTVDTNAP
jgi:hypothetical protein